MTAEQSQDLAAAFDDDPPIDVAASPRLQEILQASIDSYRRDGGMSTEEVRRRIRAWEAEERAAGEAGE